MKLKHKLTYKGHYQEKHEDTGNITNGLHDLILNNTWYKDVSNNSNWVNTLEEMENETNEDEVTESDEKVETCIDNDIFDKDDDDAPEIQDFSHIKPAWDICIILFTTCRFGSRDTRSTF